VSVAGEPAPAVDAERPVSLLRGLSDSSAFRLLEAAPLATVVSDCSGTIVFVNPRAEALFGYRAGELLGRPVELLVPRRLRDSHTKLRATQDANGSVGPKVGRVLSAERKDGSTFVVEIQLGRAETDEGPLYQAVFIDVSARETGFAAQVARQTALADLGRLGLTAPVQEVLDATVAVVWHHLGADRVIFSELARDGLTLVVHAAAGDKGAVCYPAGRGSAAEYVLERSDPVPIEVLLARCPDSPLHAGGIKGGLCVRLDSGDGLPQGILSAHFISERRLVEDEISFMRSGGAIISGALDMAQLEPLFDLSMDPLAVIDRDGYIVRGNAAWERTLGWTLEDLYARRLLELVHPDDEPKMAAAAARLRQTCGEVVDLESRYRTPSGEYRNLLVSARSSQDGHWIYATAKDITLLRRHEAELGQLAADNDLILQSAGEGICRVDSTGATVYANPACAELLGWEVSELIGRNMQELAHYAHADGSPFPVDECPLFQAIKSGDVLRVTDDVFWRADGTSFPAEYTAAPVRENGQITGAVMIFSDISARQHLEAEAQLKRAAEQANQAKSEFLSRMSHELRTPLNAILGFSQLLARAPLAERERRFCQHVTKGGQHLLTLIDEVLEISRIESGNLGISLEPVRLECALNDALELIAPIADQHHVSLQADVGEHAEAYVLADLQRLKQVLLNLLSNAVKYNRPHGQVRITASSDHETLTLAVSDTGPGIAAEDLPRLFDPFDRLGAEATGIEGTGLGLTLSRRLTEAMGGTLEVVSETGVGSTFQLQLATSTSPDATLTSRPRHTPRTTSSVACTVLCIEDNIANLRLIEEVLADEHIEVIAAASGQLGIDIAASTHPDVVLLDLNLPDKPGHTVLSSLRANPQTADIPVIAVTADATDTQRRRMLELGVSAYLTKPLDIDTLITTIADACPSRR
jgi:PAS domain S-box-containing protein